jgi:hypothetical protein
VLYDISGFIQDVTRLFDKFNNSANAIMSNKRVTPCYILYTVTKTLSNRCISENAHNYNSLTIKITW